MSMHLAEKFYVIYVMSIGYANRDSWETCSLNLYFYFTDDVT